MGRISHIPSRTLVFNPYKKLVAIVQSTTAAAKIFNTQAQGIHEACTGECMSCKGFYFRTLDKTVEITWEDLGTLRLEEYDELCGVKRKIYETSAMSRKGMKYKKKIKENGNRKSNQQIGE